MIASILNTNCALTRCSSGFGTPISLNTLRLPISYPLLLIDPLLCYSFGLAQSLPNQFDVAARRLASDLRFFLEGVENVHRPCVPHSVHRSKSVATKVPDHFQNPCAAKAGQRLRVAVFAAALSYASGIAYVILYRLGELDYVAVSPTHPHPPAPRTTTTH